MVMVKLKKKKLGGALRKLISPRDATRRLKNRPKNNTQSGTPGGNIQTESNKKPTSKPISDEKGHGRGRFQKGSAPAPENQNVSTRVEDDAADFVNKGGAGKVESRGDRMVRGTVGGGSKSSPEAGKEKVRLQAIIRDKSKTKRQRDAAQEKLDKMRAADEAATDKARSSAAKTRRATTEKNRGKIKDPAGHFMQTGEIVEGFNPTPKQIEKANMNAGRRKGMGKKKSNAKKFEEKKGGGKIYKRKHGGKVVSGNDGNSIVAGCYD